MEHAIRTNIGRNAKHVSCYQLRGKD